MKFIDFFAGVGGFRHGLELAGHKCVGFCEFDKFATASYTAMHLCTEEQLKYLKSLPMRQRQKEILKPEYRNGEWYAQDVRSVRADNIPRADMWCAGFPCQDISLAGKQLGFKGRRSSLFFAITNIIRGQKEENRPEWLLFENVKNLFSVNRGFDFAKLLIELDEIGYDVQWQTFNSNDFGVPQNRERIYIIGHNRNRGEYKQVFPITGCVKENSCVQQIGNYTPTKTRSNPNHGRIYDSHGLSLCLNACGGGNLAPSLAYYCFVDLANGAGVHITENARCLQARYSKGASNRKENSGIMQPVLKVRNATRGGYADVKLGDSINLSQPNSATRRGRVGDQIANTLDTSCNQGIPIPIDAKSCSMCNNEVITLTLDDGKEIGAVWYEPYQCYIAVRKFTPRECFRLQGWTDDYFEKAALVNSDSQLYKQAGNGVTVNVVQAIGVKLKEA